jgi:maltose O-acetyltransferase
MRSEKEKMLAGELYVATDPQLVAERRRARDLLHALNASRDAETELRASILRELLGATGEGVFIEPPFHCDYGSNIHLGDRVYFNFDCVVLDVARVTIGSDTMFGPAVQIYTATHPMEYQPRRAGREFAKPVTIGSDVWVGGGAIILPGVTIGSRTVIGAGSVVTRDVPEGVFAAGNPCRVLRLLEPHPGPAHPLSTAPHIEDV